VEQIDPPNRIFNAQVIALKRIHEVDRRQDRYCLLLSDGHCKEGSVRLHASATSNEFKEELSTEEAFLTPDLNWLVEEKRLRLYSFIRVTNYMVIPLPDGAK
jgi:hypothetical protein